MLSSFAVAFQDHHCIARKQLELGVLEDHVDEHRQIKFGNRCFLTRTYDFHYMILHACFCVGHFPLYH